MSSIARNQSQPCSPLLLPFLLLTGILASFLFASAPVPARAYTLPDTGQTLCFDDSTASIVCLSRGKPFSAQDGNFRGPQPKFTDNGNGTATDTFTGLIWQIDANTSGIEGKSWEDAGNTCSGLNLGGTGWRLPTQQELLSTVNLGVWPTTSLPGPQADAAPYWSSTPVAGSATDAWGVDFSTGKSERYAQTDSYSVRCVKGSALPGPSLTDNGNGTVSDASTGLMWEKTGSATPAYWQNALDYCTRRTTGGYKDWRLPNRRELLTITDYSLTGSVLPAVFTPSTNLFWASTTYNTYSPYGWRVSFSDGLSDGYWKVTQDPPQQYARCVRGGRWTYTPMAGVPGALLLLVTQ